MSLISINLDGSYFTDFLGAKAQFVPESVIRDAETNLEKYLRNHSEEFWTALSGAIEKSIEDNREELVKAGAANFDDDEDFTVFCENCGREPERDESCNETKTGTVCESCFQLSTGDDDAPQFPAPPRPGFYQSDN